MYDNIMMSVEAPNVPKNYREGLLSWRVPSSFKFATVSASRWSSAFAVEGSRPASLLAHSISLHQGATELTSAIARRG